MNISRILTRFPEVPQPLWCEAQPSADGLINSTWMLGDRFVLQRVNPLFGPDVNEDIRALTEVLRRADVPVPRLLLSADGAPYVEDEGVWRVMTQLAGRTIHRVERAAQAHSAAALIARFHYALSDQPHTFAFTRPGAHDTAAHMKALKAALKRHTAHHLHAEVSRINEALQSAWAALSPPSPLPACIVHGDLKISNILFSDTDEAIGLIDLDTMAWSDLEVELGDALRSWCSTTTEDAPNPELDIAIFEAAVTGYIEHSPELNAPQREAIVRGLERITLELSARFAADALNESYFGWNPEVAESRGEHNLIRAMNQLQLAESVAKARPTVTSIVMRAAR